MQNPPTLSLLIGEPGEEQDILSLHSFSFLFNKRKSLYSLPLFHQAQRVPALPGPRQVRPPRDQDTYYCYILMIHSPTVLSAIKLAFQSLILLSQSP